MKKGTAQKQAEASTPKPHLEVVNGQVKTTSLDIAEKFGKRHDNVLRGIETLECSDDFRLLNFEAVEIIEKNAIGGVVKRKTYSITRDGFTILVMGFTGKKAMAWKERYIAAFNAMEKRLIDQQREAFETGNSGLTPAQQRVIQHLVSAKAMAMSNSEKPKRDAYITIYRNIKDRFMVGSYKDIPQKQFGELEAYLRGEQFQANTPTDLASQGKDHLNAKIDRSILKKMRVYCAEHEMAIQDFLAEAMPEKLTATAYDGAYEARSRSTLSQEDIEILLDDIYQNTVLFNDEKVTVEKELHYMSLCIKRIAESVSILFPHDKIKKKAMWNQIPMSK